MVELYFKIKLIGLFVELGFIGLGLLVGLIFWIIWGLKK